ncbi:MAG: TrmB family transcriptional regulator, partial [Stackebrandtia sp.]
MADDETYALGPLGLSACAEDVYRALLSLPQADLKTLADRLELPVDTVSRHMPELLTRELVKMVTDELYVATSPELSIVTLLSARMEEIRRTCAAVGQLERTYRETRRHDERLPGTEIVSGLDAIRSRLEQLNSRARNEVRMFMRHPLITTDAGGSVRDPALNSAVRYRNLFEKALLDDSAVVELIRRSVERGYQLRFAATLPVKLAIADDN